MKKILLEEILETEPEAVREPQPLTGVVVGHLVAVGPAGELLVDYPGNRTGGPLRATTTVPLQAADTGCEVALLFENGDGSRPLVIGPIMRPETDTTQKVVKASEAIVDGERVTFTAEKEIVLSCGAASITLTKAGKILIRGKYVLSRSSGVNRIKGGSIQLN